MAALTAVVAALSLAVGVNFVFLLAIVRRLRMQRPAARKLPMPTVGTRVPRFAIDDIEGRPVDERFCTEHPDAVIAFLSDTCEPCDRVKAELMRNPLQVPLLAFVQTTNDPSAQSDLANALAASGARIVPLGLRDKLPSQFPISAFPTLMRVHNGIVAASSMRLADIRDQPRLGSQSARNSRDVVASEDPSEVAEAATR